MVMSIGCSVPSSLEDPSLDQDPHHHEKSQGRGDVEGVTHQVLVQWNVNLVSIIVDALDDLDGSVASWK